MNPEQVSSIVREVAVEPGSMAAIGWVTGVLGYLGARIVNAKFSNQEQYAEDANKFKYKLGIYAGALLSGIVNGGLFWAVSEAVK